MKSCVMVFRQYKVNFHENKESNARKREISYMRNALESKGRGRFLAALAFAYVTFFCVHLNGGYHPSTGPIRQISRLAECS